MLDIILIVIVIIILKAVIVAIIQGALGRPRKLKPEESIDWINVMYKHNKLASKLGKREIRGKLLLTGDGSIVPIAYKYTGYIPGNTVIDIFWKPKWYALRSKWVIVPTELIYDINAKNIRINCKSFRPINDVFWIPVFSYLDRDEMETYMDQIANHIEWLTHYMGIVLSAKNRLDAFATASKTKEPTPGYIRTRDGLSPNEVAYNQKPEAQTEEPL
jgi:hypothetical protein